MWSLFQLLVMFTDLASNIHWHWTPNGYLGKRRSPELRVRPRGPVSRNAKTDPIAQDGRRIGSK
jgi:hypothetical protein